MPQALHGGSIAQAAREFGVPADSILDFSANINVFAPSIPSEIWERWRKEISHYPEADPESIRQRLAWIFAASPSHILPTAGAIEALYLVARLFTKCKVAVIEPTFSDYARALEAAQCTFQRVVLPPELWHRPALEWAHLLEPFDVIIFGNPNNPTGSMQTRKQLRDLFKLPWKSPKSWIVDEAFIEFSPGFEHEHLLSKLDVHPSLIIIRSLTKSWAIPGLRLGFLATANQEWMEQLGSMQPPWSINSLAAQWASEFLTPEALQDLLVGIGELTKLGLRLAEDISQIPGLRVYPSDCNFLLIETTHGALDSECIYRELGQRGILIRRCDSFHGMPKRHFIRLAVRRGWENERLVEELSLACRKLTGESE